jgi:hypothetical protein
MEESARETIFLECEANVIFHVIDMGDNSVADNVGFLV